MLLPRGATRGLIPCTDLAVHEEAVRPPLLPTHTVAPLQCISHQLPYTSARLPRAEEEDALRAEGRAQHAKRGEQPRQGHTRGALNIVVEVAEAATVPGAQDACAWQLKSRENVTAKRT